MKKSMLYLFEPALHVNKKEFEDTIKKAEKYGFVITDKPKVFLSRTVVLSLSIQRLKNQ